jgi:hypothetical protein
LAVNFCCFSSLISRLLKNIAMSCPTIHDNGGGEEDVRGPPCADL